MNLSTLAIQKALEHKWEEAITVNQQIVDQDPKNIDALNRLAQAQLQLGDPQAAKTTYELALSIDQFNPIAIRNLQKIKMRLNWSDHHKNGHCAPKLFHFIEEPGKTKIVSLVRLGDRSTLSVIQPCLQLNFNIRMQNICLYYNKNYIGKLPDDISKRLIWLYKRQNRYAIFVKAVNNSKVSVFIKEIRRSYLNKNYASFANVDKDQRN